ncbi:hypothetical protein DSECCO2_422610 [anaerobic digester metagenome]
MKSAKCSEWRVTSNLIGGEKMYAVYRLRNTAEVDHSGNREYAGGWSSNREAVAMLAAELNKGGVNESNQNNN